MQQSSNNGGSTHHVNKKSKTSDYEKIPANRSPSTMGPLPLSRVESILGVTEQELVALPPNERKRFIAKKSTPSDDDDGKGEGKFFVHRKTGEQTPIGSFSTPTFGELREQVITMQIKTAGKDNGDNVGNVDDNAGDDKGKASTAATGTPSTKECKFYALYGIDIGEFQTRLRTKDKCMVQIASNFNCLCVSGRKKKAPDCGDLVELAHESKTQGPAATFGPLASNLYRTHFCMEPNYSGQTLSHQINLLDQVSEYTGFPINGKLTLKGSETPVGDNDKDISQVAGKVRVGLQTNCRILFGRNKEHADIRLNDSEDGTGIDIDQCYTATINWNSLTSDHNRKHVPAWTRELKKRSELIALNRALLRAAYEAVYLAALVRRRQHLYLTLVGGGVFGNPYSLIVEELARAHKKWANHPHSCLEGVYLCAYSEGDNVEDLLTQEGIEICKDVPSECNS